LSFVSAKGGVSQTRHGIGSILGRIAAVIASLVVIGIVLRLFMAILAPVLPVGLMQLLTAGWNTLLGIVGPALVPVVALGIVAAVVWIVVGRRR
jgi:hypothetical protein